MCKSGQNSTNTAKQRNLANASASGCCRKQLLLGASLGQGVRSQDLKATDCQRCRLSIAFNFIDRAALRDVTEAAVADLFGVSASRLRHLWKLYLGIGFRQYMIRMRMERARELIFIQGLSVKAAAAELGIEDPSHLYRDIRRHLPVIGTTSHSIPDAAIDCGDAPQY